MRTGPLGQFRVAAQRSTRRRRASQTDAAPTIGLTRRSALVAIGTVGLGAFLAACARAAGNGPASTIAGGSTREAVTGGATTTPAAVSLDCVMLPEITEGPYYLDLDLVRSDITEDRVGAPLALILVADAESCTPNSGCRGRHLAL